MIDSRASVNALMSFFRRHLIVDRAIILFNGEIIATYATKVRKVRRDPWVQDRNVLVVAV